MARGDVLNRQLAQRITDSPHTLVVVYPPARPVVTGTAPTTTPLNPLTGPAPTLTVFPTAPTPERPNFSIKCLWLDSFQNATSSTSRFTVNRVGWLAGADALARVLVADAALNAAAPWQDTVFTAAEHVEFQGRRYRVVAVQPLMNSFTAPLTYHVWLTGAAK